MIKSSEKYRDVILRYAKDFPRLNFWQIAEKIIRDYKLHTTPDSFRKVVKEVIKSKDTLTPRVIEDKIAVVGEQIARDVEKRNDKMRLRELEQKNDYLINRTEHLEKALSATLEIKKSPQSLSIEPSSSTGSKSTAILVASDWHYEEKVNPNHVSELNEYDTDIATRRIKKFFQNGLELIRINSHGTKIEKVVLALLGDFISGAIHDDVSESCTMRPTQAIWAVQGHIISGIEFLLENTECDIIIPCHSGNHARTTKEQRHANESGYSLEWLMYKSLELHYKTNKRVTFMVAEGYHTYLNIYGYTVRFSHGHAIRYAGGIGGVFIPAFKAVSQWNKGRHADLDIFGHFHQSKDGGNFICNGSLIGFNAYAIGIKADFEKPKQTFVLVSSKYKCKTVITPIFLE